MASMDGIDGKIFVITGAAGGIGSAMAWVHSRW